MSNNQFPHFLSIPSELLPPNWHKGSEIVYAIFTNAQNALCRDITDLFRIQFHHAVVMNEGIPMLLAMEGSVGENGEGLCKSWLEAAANCYGLLIGQLESAEATARTGEDNSNIEMIKPVNVIRTGKRGRPRKVPNKALLTEAMQPSRRITKALYARKIGVSTRTLTTYMKNFGIEYKFSEITDKELDSITREVQHTRPGTGRRYLAGHLASAGIKVQMERIRQSLARVDPIGQAIRNRDTVTRRNYRIPRPNAMWHIDGHHKLIRWGIVIHGIIDGFCRTIVGLRASTNNRASTVLAVFADAVESFGTPSRVRGDRGGENRRVASVMIKMRGLKRGSFMWGTSMHNTRIERLWVEVGSRLARQWRAFFLRLERLHRLDVKNPFHLWLLHQLFLDAINDDINTFEQEWNSHPISGIGHEKSPKDMRLLGMIEHGIYTDDPPEEEGGSDDHGYESSAFEDEDTHTESSTKYDFDGESEVEDEGGLDEEDSESEWEDETFELQLGAAIDASCSSEYNHKPVKVPRHIDPFAGKPHCRATFIDALDNLDDVGVPQGWGVYDNEYPLDKGYPLDETIPTSGTRRNKKLVVTLPQDIWHPRATMWVKAVRLLRISLENNNDSSESD
ncbi:hypothetical protein PQX77_014961 [Marasmius sp. AFHP31]|nr:hypothetical protein PQX77_018358 [Marasmius sp. AFHP31]KAK1220237.1 hypothetical protein PQX77_017023 [Marasmius sp. AFHP31]KAK1222200.1 hypothetical protein PQX77_014961 [Marasmius sp. AFHP31]